jgi:hypothetical protein
MLGALGVLVVSFDRTDLERGFGRRFPDQAMVSPTTSGCH